MSFLSHHNENYRQWISSTCSLNNSVYHTVDACGSKKMMAVDLKLLKFIYTSNATLHLYYSMISVLAFQKNEKTCCKKWNFKNKKYSKITVPPDSYAIAYKHKLLCRNTLELKNSLTPPPFSRRVESQVRTWSSDRSSQEYNSQDHISVSSH